MRKGILALALMLGSIAAQAATFSFVTPTGSTTSGGAVNAQADFTTNSNGTLTIKVYDLQTDPTNVAQLISDLFFTVSNGGTALTSGTYTSGSGQGVTVNGNGTATALGSINTTWALTNSSGVFHLDDLGAGASGPANLIIGGPGAGGTYANANGSIAGNGPHNPFLLGTMASGGVTFNLAIPGVTANSSVSSVVFSFGTTSGINVSAVQNPLTPTPEPSSVILLSSALGLAGFAGFRRRRQNKIA